MRSDRQGLHFESGLRRSVYTESERPSSEIDDKPPDSLNLDRVHVLQSLPRLTGSTKRVQCTTDVADATRFSVIVQLVFPDVLNSLFTSLTFPDFSYILFLRGLTRSFPFQLASAPYPSKLLVLDRSSTLPPS